MKFANLTPIRVAACLLSTIALLLPTAALLAQEKPPVREKRPTQPLLAYRWVWSMHNLVNDDQVTALLALMRRAKAAGYNGFALSDYKFNVLNRMDAHYFANVEKVKTLAKELNLILVPTVAPIGYSNGLLAHDPNLAEGLPVKNADFTVQGHTADVTKPAAPLYTNGGFESHNGDTFAGFSFQDYPGTASFADTIVKHGGNVSLRFEGVGKADPQNGHGRIAQSIAVAPFRQYHLSVWIKTQEWERPGETRAVILTDKGSSLAFNNWHIQRTQDWTQYDTVFNSQNNAKVTVYLGVWGGQGGKLWLDDARVDEVGLLNALRRQGCPVTVKSADGATTYREGFDYETISDPRMGTVPWAGEYEVYHAPPTLQIPPGSKIQSGQRLKVSFYHTLTIYDGQVSSCISDPKVYSLLSDQFARVQKLLAPPGFFFSHDEFRIANWCETCQARHLTPGAMLADNMRRCVAMAKVANPKASVFVWSDMFDPYHNAVDGPYYLVNGSWKNSWDGLPKETIVVNWNPEKRNESLPFFANRGNRQILAGYYDGDPNSIKGWLDDARKYPGLVGAMYTTWNQNYDALETFAKAAWGQ